MIYRYIKWGYEQVEVKQKVYIYKSGIFIYKVYLEMSSSYFISVIIEYWPNSDNSTNQSNVRFLLESFQNANTILGNSRHDS